MPIIELPNGKNAEFPDDMSRDDIKLAIRKRFPLDSNSNNIEKNKSFSIKESLRNFIPEPSMPLGLNVASGLLSLAGRSPQEKNTIRDLPQVLSQKQPGLPEKFAQGIGEYLPLAATGVGAAEGLAGILGRVAATSGYGAAINPQDRIGGAEEGALVGSFGEALPAALKGIGSLAEKVRPVKFVKDKISETLRNFKETEGRQQDAYKKAFEKIGDKKVIDDPLTTMGHHDPKEYLGFDKKNLSPDSKDLYDNFLKEPNVKNLHELQSQIYKDSMTFKKNPNKVNSFQKARKIRNSLNKKIEKVLESDPEAKSNYMEGKSITRDELKPYLETPELRKIVSGKIKEMEPKKYQSALKKLLEKEHGRIPENHYLRSLKNELDSKLGTSEITNEAIPENLRKWSPNFAKLAQNPNLMSILQSLNKGIYQPSKMSATGNLLQP